MEGGDDLQLEKGDLVELVRVENSGNFTVRLVNDPTIVGNVPPSFLRSKDSVVAATMEGESKNRVRGRVFILFLFSNS